MTSGAMNDPAVLVRKGSDARNDERYGSSARKHGALKERTGNGDEPVVVAKGRENQGRWSEQEHSAFLRGLQKYGREWRKVAAEVGTRTVSQNNFEHDYNITIASALTRIFSFQRLCKREHTPRSFT